MGSRRGRGGFLLTAVGTAALLGMTGCMTAGDLPGAGSKAGDAPQAGPDQSGDRYFDLRQITPDNVGQLQMAWRYDTGPGGMQTTPLFRGGMLFVVTPSQEVAALDPATGREIWKYVGPAKGFQPVRGLSYWEEGGERRLFSSLGSTLIALDPQTGQPVRQFGADGAISLRDNLDRDPAKVATFLTSPGIVYGDVIIVGFRTGESPPAAPGAIRAYDVRTGELRWTFNLIPRPGEAGHDSWPADAWRSAGGANAWAGMALDEKRGILYAPTGSAVDDFYGADRHGDNLFANSLVALDARTGKHVWHFQTVHHDLWDRDLPSPPALVTVTRKGRRVDAVAQPSKQGFLYLFDRVTGAPLFPIEERSVAASDVPGEKSSPTQPFVTIPEPFARQRLTADMLTNRTPEARAAALKAFAGMRSDGPFTPFSVDRPTVIFPGFDGGAEWGGPAVDRKRGVIYINANDVPWTGQLARRAPTVAVGSSVAARGASLYVDQCSACHGADRKGSPPAFPSLLDLAPHFTAAQIAEVIQQGRGRMPGFPQIAAADRAAVAAYLRGDREDEAPGDGREVSSPVSAGAARAPYYFTGYRKFQDPDGYPAAAPPWGTLNAIDLNSGKYLWKIPLGYYPELMAKGAPVTGTENYGGPIITSTGLLFIGATIYDRKLRAFEARSGRQLWEASLPFAGVATPTSYVAGGRQFIVIATSGQRTPKGPKGSAYVAYALPAR